MDKNALHRMTITNEEGTEIPFREFIREFGGSGTLYEKDIRDIFKNWPLADWAYVDDYIAPIAAQVLADAAEIDRESYAKIMKLISDVYEKLRSEVNHPYLTRIK